MVQSRKEIRSKPVSKSVIRSYPRSLMNTKTSLSAPPVRISSPQAADQDVAAKAADQLVIALIAGKPVITVSVRWG